MVSANSVALQHCDGRKNNSSSFMDFSVYPYMSITYKTLQVGTSRVIKL